MDSYLSVSITEYTYMEDQTQASYRARLSIMRRQYASHPNGEDYRRITTALTSTNPDMIREAYVGEFAKLGTEERKQIEKVTGHPTKQKIPTTMGLKTFKLRARSREDVYNILTTEGNYYLPRLSSCTMAYLGDILSGTKLAFKSNEVKYCKVPHFPEFEMEYYTEEIRSDPELGMYLPDLRQKVKPDREYFFNVFNTLFPNQITKAVKKSLGKRHKVFVDEEQPIPMSNQMKGLFEGSSYTPIGYKHHAGAGNLTAKYQSKVKQKRKKRPAKEEIKLHKAKRFLAAEEQQEMELGMGEVSLSQPPSESLGGDVSQRSSQVPHH